MNVEILVWVAVIIIAIAVETAGAQVRVERIEGVKLIVTPEP